MMNGGRRRAATLFRPIKHSGHNYSTLIFIQGRRVPRQNRNAFRITNSASRVGACLSAAVTRGDDPFTTNAATAGGRFLIKKQTLSLARPGHNLHDEIDEPRRALTTRCNGGGDAMMDPHPYEILIKTNTH